LAAALFGLSTPDGFSQGAGQAMVLRYLNITGGQVRNLVIDARFPLSPDLIYYTNLLSTPTALADNYGQWMIGFLVPTNSGWYRFAVTSDDASALWVSTNESPAHLHPRCFTVGSSGTANFNNAGHRQQQSTPVYLEQGRHYYFEALHKEGTGGDGLRVAWQELLPGGLTNVQNSNLGIPGTFLKSAINPGPVSFYTPPADVRVQEGDVPVFEVQFDGDGPFDYEWFVNGTGQGPQKTFVPRSTLALPAASLFDDGTTVYVVASNQGGARTATSRTAQLSVVADTTPPAIVEAMVAATDPATLYLTFSEPVSAVDLTDPFNYTISSGTTVQTVAPSADGRSVVVTLDNTLAPITDLATLTLLVLTDQAPIPNAAHSVRATVYVNEGTIRYQRFEGTGSQINNLVDIPVYPYYPSLVEFRPTFSSGANVGDNYGTRFQGYVRVGRAGWYRFGVASDDRAALFLSRDSSTTNLMMICGQAHSQGALNYNNHRMSQSGPIYLEAGRRYYVESLHKEGTGGDNMDVTLQYISGVQTNHLTSNVNGPIPNGTPVVQSIYLNPYNEAVSIDPNYPRGLNTQICSPTQTLQVRLLSGSPFLNIQWYNALSHTPIADATNADLRLPPPLTNGSFYCVIANLVNVVTSRTAVVTVPSYTKGPSIAAASTLDGLTVGITFDRVVDPAQGQDAFNYSIVDPVSGVPLAGIQSAVNLGSVPAPLGDLAAGGVRYVLTLDAPVTTSFNVRAANIQDCLGQNLDPAGAEYLVVPWGTGVNIGLPPHPLPLQGTNFPISAGNVDVRVPGADIWNTADEFHFVYRPIQGDFDLKVHTPRLDRVNVWAKSGLMARVSLDANSRMLYAVTADYLVAGEARLALGRRDSIGGGAANWPTDPRPPMPRELSWVRLKRVGNTFTAYYSTNGLYWATVSSYTPAWGADLDNPLFVGLCTTSHTTNANTTAEYRHYGDTSFPGANINIVQQPGNVSTPQGTKASFEIKADVINASPDELSYQWQRSDGAGGFANIVGATAAKFTTGFLMRAADHGAQYRVILKIPGLTVTSAVATLTVQVDTIRPTLLYAVNLNPTTVAAFFSEPMHADAGDPFLWAIDGGVLIVDAVVNAANPTRVDLTLSGLTALSVGTLYTITAGTDLGGSVTDLEDNPTDPDPASASFVAVNDYFAGAVAGNTGGRTTQPDFVTVLPTSGRLPLGTLTERGFDCRMVQFTNIFANDTAVAEQVLAGSYLVGFWPFQTPAAPNFAGRPTFVESNLINYNTGVNAGRLIPDRPFPGIPNPAYPPTGPGDTNYMALEALTYLRLNKGLYRLGVNSDDAFRVSPATSASDPANAITVGEFNGGRGSADTTFDISVPEDGLYPFRLIWEQGTGGANLEFWTYDLLTGAYVAVNDDAGVLAYRPAAQPPTPPPLTISLVGGSPTICWPKAVASGFTVTLQSTDSLNPPVNWAPVPGTPTEMGDQLCLTLPAGTQNRFFRLHIQ
jgi:hypothetical protein